MDELIYNMLTVLSPQQAAMVIAYLDETPSDEVYEAFAKAFERLYPQEAEQEFSK